MSGFARSQQLQLSPRWPARAASRSPACSPTCGRRSAAGSGTAPRPDLAVLRRVRRAARDRPRLRPQRHRRRRASAPSPAPAALSRRRAGPGGAARHARRGGRRRQGAAGPCRGVRRHRRGAHGAPVRLRRRRARVPRTPDPPDLHRRRPRTRPPSRSWGATPSRRHLPTRARPRRQSLPTGGRVHAHGRRGWHAPTHPGLRRRAPTRRWRSARCASSRAGRRRSRAARPLMTGRRRDRRTTAPAGDCRCAQPVLTALGATSGPRARPAAAGVVSETLAGVHRLRQRHRSACPAHPLIAGPGPGTCAGHRRDRRRRGRPPAGGSRATSPTARRAEALLRDRHTWAEPPPGFADDLLAAVRRERDRAPAVETARSAASPVDVAPASPGRGRGRLLAWRPRHWWWRWPPVWSSRQPATSPATVQRPRRRRARGSCRERSAIGTSRDRCDTVGVRDHPGRGGTASCAPDRTTRRG